MAASFQLCPSQNVNGQTKHIVPEREMSVNVLSHAGHLDIRSGLIRATGATEEASRMKRLQDNKNTSSCPKLTTTTSGA